MLAGFDYSAQAALSPNQATGWVASNPRMAGQPHSHLSDRVAGSVTTLDGRCPYRRWRGGTHGEVQVLRRRTREVERRNLALQRVRREELVSWAAVGADPRRGQFGSHCSDCFLLIPLRNGPSQRLAVDHPADDQDNKSRNEGQADSDQRQGDNSKSGTHD